MYARPFSVTDCTEMSSGTKIIITEKSSGLIRDFMLYIHVKDTEKYTRKS